MATLFVQGSLLFLIIRAWSQKRTRFAELARAYLCLTPFIPLVSLINHNVDHERFGVGFRLAPFFVMSFLLLISFDMNKYAKTAYRFSKESLLLGGYGAFSLISAVFATDASWAIISWSWTVPGCLLFLIAGQLSSVDDVTRDGKMVYVVLGFLSINLSLVAFGLLTGRATDVFHTRNFGSCFASNAVLLFLTIYSGLGWLHARTSFLRMFMFIGFSALSILISISRTSVAVALIYVSFLLTLHFRQFRRLTVALAVAAGFLWIALFAFERVSGLQFTNQLAVNWKNRLGHESLQGTFEAAMSHRVHIFNSEWREVIKQNPFIGQGYGNFQQTTTSGFRDGHNLLLTELYENGWVATGFFYLLLAVGVWHAVRKFAAHSRDEWPIAFCFLGFLFVAHTTGAVLSSRGVDSYFTPVTGWGLCFLIGMLSRHRKARSLAMAQHVHQTKVATAA